MSSTFSKQLSNFINSLIAISPSRNYITQFLYLIRAHGSIDYRILEDAYPDIVKDEYTRNAIAKAFGVSFGEKVSLDATKYGWQLTSFIDEVFKLFEDSDFRAKASSLLKEEFPEGIPNLVEEWLSVRIDGLKSEPNYGVSSIKLLKEIVRVGRLKIEDLERKFTDMTRGFLLQCLSLLELYRLVTKEYDGSYRPRDDLRKYQSILEKV